MSLLKNIFVKKIFLNYLQYLSSYSVKPFWSAGRFIHSHIVGAQTIYFWLVGMWASPGGTAMPGQPVTEPAQAPELYPLLKISLISKGGHAPRIRY